MSAMPSPEKASKRKACSTTTVSPRYPSSSCAFSTCRQNLGNRATHQSEHRQITVRPPSMCCQNKHRLNTFKTHSERRQNAVKNVTSFFALALSGERSAPFLRYLCLLYDLAFTLFYPKRWLFSQIGDAFDVQRVEAAVPGAFWLLGAPGVCGPYPGSTWNHVMSCAVPNRGITPMRDGLLCKTTVMPQDGAGQGRAGLVRAGDQGCSQVPGEQCGWQPFSSLVEKTSLFL